MTKFLVNIYKVLIRSVTDYASVITVACSSKVIKDLEVLQNESLRIIFKKSLLDHVSCEDLRSWADITTIAERHEELLTDYYEKVLIKKNPLITELFEKYRSFKLRNIISEDLAVNGNGIVDLVKLDLIRKTNISFLEKETHSTTLCGTKSFINIYSDRSNGSGSNRLCVPLIRFS